MVKPGRKPMDVAGQRFGKLTVEKYVPNTKKVPIGYVLAIAAITSSYL